MLGDWRGRDALILCDESICTYVPTRSRIIGRSPFTPIVGDKPAHRKTIVKKTFNLNIEGKNRDRVLEAAKHEIRQYVRRERRKPLPEGVDFLDFDCRFGASKDNAAEVHFASITGLIDALVNDGGDSFYLEVVSKGAVRTPRKGGDEDEQLES